MHSMPCGKGISEVKTCSSVAYKLVRVLRFKSQICVEVQIHTCTLTTTSFFLKVSCKSSETQKGNLWFKHKKKSLMTFIHVIKQMDNLSNYMITHVFINVKNNVMIASASDLYKTTRIACIYSGTFTKCSSSEL